MARTLNRLTALGVSRLREAGLYCDGGGLYLQASKTGARSWIFRYTRNGHTRDMGLGSFLTVTLAEARNGAANARSSIAAGKDPLSMRRQASRAEDSITFKDAALRYIEAKQSGWRNAKHAAQWPSTLEMYAFPVFGNVAVAEVDTDHLLKAIQPIWTTKNETARRVRGRIENILDWARAKGLRTGENPARLREHLQHMLAEHSRAAAVDHHAALPYLQIGGFLAALRRKDGVAARAMEFTILTAARTGEVIGARIEEFDLERALWIIPGSRMKAGREHRVPLSAPALAIVKGMIELSDGGYLFPGGRTGKPLSNMERGDLTVHGFRSTFRDWAAEATSHSNEVAEMALAHAVGNRIEAAYRRGDLFEKRRQIMTDWAAYCSRTRLRRDAEAVSISPRGARCLGALVSDIMRKFVDQRINSGSPRGELWIGICVNAKLK